MYRIPQVFAGMAMLCFFANSAPAAIPTPTTQQGYSLNAHVQLEDHDGVVVILDRSGATPQVKVVASYPATGELTATITATSEKVTFTATGTGFIDADGLTGTIEVKVVLGGETDYYYVEAD